MRILAFVDLHGDIDTLEKLNKKVKKEKVDLCLFAGDISFFSENIMEYLSMINDFNVPTLLIHGNHEEESETKEACLAFKNLIFIHKQVVDIDNVRFFGYGGGGFSTRDKKFEKLANSKFAKKIDRRMKNILLLHGPPYGTKLDLLGEEFVGNESYSIFIRKTKLDYVICGHIHENEGKSDTLEGTIILNPGPEGIIIEV